MMEDNNQMRRSTEVVHAPGGTMKKVLRYDISSYLFNKERLMTKPQKSVLVYALGTKITNDDERAPAKDSELQTACITDVMANNYQKDLKNIYIQTFGHFCEQFQDYISVIGQETDMLDLVFDSYVEGSIKESERNRR